VARGGFGGIEIGRRRRKKEKNNCLSLMQDIEMLSGY
jgi:hypothetical protein